MDWDFNFDDILNEFSTGDGSSAETPEAQATEAETQEPETSEQEATAPVPARRSRLARTENAAPETDEFTQHPPRRRTQPQQTQSRRQRMDEEPHTERTQRPRRETRSVDTVYTDEEEYTERKTRSVEVPGPQRAVRSAEATNLQRAAHSAGASDPRRTVRSASVRNPENKTASDHRVRPERTSGPDGEQQRPRKVSSRRAAFEDEEEVAPTQSRRRTEPVKAVPEPRRTREDDYDEEYEDGKHGHAGMIALLVFLLLVAGIVGGGIYAGIRVTNSSTIFPNVYVENVSVGGLTQQEAQAALEAAGWQERVETPLHVTTYGGVSVDVDPLRAGAVQDAQTEAAAAYAYGHSGNILQNLTDYLKSRFGSVNVSGEAQPIDTAYLADQAALCQQELEAVLGTEAYTVNKENETLDLVKGQGSLQLDTAEFVREMQLALQNGQTELNFTAMTSTLERPDFQSIYTLLSADPSDARYTDDGTFNVIEETVGCQFDVSAANALWDSAQPGETVSVPLTITYPEVTAEQLEGQLYRDLLGVMTTDYSASVENRKNNVRLATSKIDGLIMYPGDEFSYNTVVGARTKEAGFLSAPAYSNGEVVEEIGGGACQVSSTLYSACLFARMEITDRTCHYFRVTYMPLGTDATVTIPSEGNAVDYCFRNNRSYPIKIVGTCEETEVNGEMICKLTFQIWGTREEGDYAVVDFDNSNQYSASNQWHYEVEIDDPGEFQLAKMKLLTDYYSAFDDAVGRQCTRTLTYLIITDLDGNEISNECVNPLLASGTPAMDTYYNH